ncbi:MAG: protein kinase [Lachnospiraceae bacterium]
MFRVGDILDKTYQLIEEIGAGGTGIIYKAYHLRLCKYVVVKKIKDNFVGSINQRGEVDILKKLHHTYLPQVYDFLQIDQQVFTVIDYVDGLNLEQYVKKGYKYTEKQMIIWLHQLLEVLEYLHSQRPPILHSDIKPANIMINREGTVCLIDFNISLDGSDEVGIQGASAAYAAPEQLLKMKLAGENQNHSHIRLDARCDIYSLGRTFVYLVNNASYECSQSFVKIISKAVSQDINGRFSSAARMKYTLENIKKEDEHYIRYRNIFIAGHICFFIIGMISLLSIYFGYNTMNEENLNVDIERLEYNEQNYLSEELIDQGIHILNTKRYQKEMNRDPHTKAWILHAVGDGYFANENYQEAAYYYEEAIEEAGEINSKATYYRDCAIARCRNGEKDEVKRILQEADTLGIDDDGIGLIKGEIALAEEAYNEAAAVLKQVELQTKDIEIRERALLQLAQIYKQTGSKKQSIEYFKKAYDLSGSSVALRQLGEAYNNSKYNKEALACYESLYMMDRPTYEDQMNYALSLEMIESYGKAEQVLLTLRKEYPNDYRLYMCMARIELAKENESKEPNYTKAKQYFNQAKKYYQGKIQNGNRDEQMDELESYMKGIR